MNRMAVDRRILQVVGEVSRPGWQGGFQESVCFAAVAEELEMGEARVLMELKAACAQGLAERTEIRGNQYRHILTEAGRIRIGAEPPLPSSFFEKLKRRLTG